MQIGGKQGASKGEIKGNSAEYRREGDIKKEGIEALEILDTLDMLDMLEGLEVLEALDIENINQPRFVGVADS